MGEPVGDVLWTVVRTTLGNAVGDNIGIAVGAQIGDVVGIVVRHTGGGVVGDDVGLAVGGPLGDIVGLIVRIIGGTTAGDDVVATPTVDKGGERSKNPMVDSVVSTSRARKKLL